MAQKTNNNPLFRDYFFYFLFFIYKVFQIFSTKLEIKLSDMNDKTESLVTEPQRGSFVSSLGKVLLKDGGAHSRRVDKGSVSESSRLRVSQPEDLQAPEGFLPSPCRGEAAGGGLS